KHEKIAKSFIDFVLSKETSSDLSKFSKAISTKNFDTNQFKIYDKYNFYLAAEDREKIMQILYKNKE
ncbi:ABC transporter substrate-binding protein, partial [Clostridium perfringens]